MTLGATRDASNADLGVSGPVARPVLANVARTLAD